MRIKIVIVLFIIATVGLSFRTVIGRTPVSDNTKVQEALADSLNDSGRWIKQHYVEGAAQATPPSGTAVTYVKTDGKLYLKDDAGTETDLTAAAGTIDGTGTTNELVYWVDSDTVGALAVATYPSLTELTYVKGVSSAIQTQLGLKAPLASPTFTGTVTIPTPFTIGAVSMTSTGTELNILDGATLTVTELNYVDGVTSAIQTQLNAKGTLSNIVEDTTPQLGGALDGQGNDLNNLGVVFLTEQADAEVDVAGKGQIWVDLATPNVLMFTDDAGTDFTIAHNATSALGSLGTVSTALTGVLRADTGVLAVDTDVTDLVTAASLTAAGKVELLTTAEINTGTDSTRAMPIDQYVASNRNVRYLALRIVEATTDVAVASTKGGDIEMPFAGTITGIGAYNDTAGTTGTMTIDVHLNGTTVMTTNKITIDTAEKTSRTAAVAPALTTTAVAVGDILTIDNDAIHTTAAKGETVWLSIRMD